MSLLLKTGRLVVDAGRLALSSCYTKCCNAIEWYCCWISNNRDEGSTCQEGPCAEGFERSGPHASEASCSSSCSTIEWYCCWDSIDHYNSTCQDGPCSSVDLYRFGPYSTYASGGIATSACQGECETKHWCCQDTYDFRKFCVLSYGPDEPCTAEGIRLTGSAWEVLGGPWDYYADQENHWCSTFCHEGTGACCKPPRECQEDPSAEGCVPHYGPVYAKNACGDCVEVALTEYDYSTRGCHVYEGALCAGGESINRVGWATLALCQHDGMEPSPCDDEVYQYDCGPVPCADRTGCVPTSFYYHKPTAESDCERVAAQGYKSGCIVYANSDCTGAPLGWENPESCEAGFATVEDGYVFHEGKACWEVNCPGDCSGSISECDGSSIASGNSSCWLSVWKCTSYPEVTIDIQGVLSTSTDWPCGGVNPSPAAQWMQTAIPDLLNRTFIINQSDPDYYCVQPITVCESGSYSDDTNTYDALVIAEITLEFTERYTPWIWDPNTSSAPYCGNNFCVRVSINFYGTACISGDGYSCSSMSCGSGGITLGAGIVKSAWACATLGTNSDRTVACTCYPVVKNCNATFDESGFDPIQTGPYNALDPCLGDLFDGATVTISIAET